MEEECGAWGLGHAVLNYIKPLYPMYDIEEDGWCIIYTMWEPGQFSQ